MESLNLIHHFLIAMPGMNDPNFRHTVTYICSHSEEGAIGIVINRPLKLMLGEVLDQMSIKFSDKNVGETPVHEGGPVQPDRGFILHQQDTGCGSSFQVHDQIYIATSVDVLSAIANGEGPEKKFIALGYAGWSPGQLEQELQENIWLSGPADSQIIFETPLGERWRSATNMLGIELEQLAPDAGHA